MTMTDHLKLALDARAKADAATEGPWKAFTSPNGFKLIGIGEATGEAITDAGFGMWRNNDEAIPNAAFIASARSDVPALCDAVEALVAENARMREALAFYRDGFVKRYKRGPTGIDHSTWEPTAALLDDNGEIARATLEPTP